jgi:hypothetical protein
MGSRAAAALYVLVMAAVVVGVDVLFFRHRFWERLMVNVGIVLVFGAFYLRFLKRPWFEPGDPGGHGRTAGWALTTERVARKPEGLDLAGLLDIIEAEMSDAPDRLQWAMNECLGHIGIEHAEYRARAIDIGERLEMLKDYPTPPGCTSPFAPIWITEMVRRQHDN